MKKQKEVKTTNNADLLKEKKTLLHEVAILKLEWSTNIPKDTNVISKKKKRLAVIETALHQVSA